MCRGSKILQFVTIPFVFSIILDKIQKPLNASIETLTGLAWLCRVSTATHLSHRPCLRLSFRSGSPTCGIETIGIATICLVSITRTSVDSWWEWSGRWGVYLPCKVVVAIVKVPHGVIVAIAAIVKVE